MSSGVVGPTPRVEGQRGYGSLKGLGHKPPKPKIRGSWIVGLGTSSSELIFLWPHLVAGIEGFVEGPTVLHKPAGATRTKHPRLGV